MREILEYILRDMTSPLGGFYSAEDADSEGVEGKFYTWSAEELKESLGEEDFSLLIRLFDVHEGETSSREETSSDRGQALPMPPPPSRSLMRSYTAGRWR